MFVLKYVLQTLSTNSKLST